MLVIMRLVLVSTKVYVSNAPFLIYCVKNNTFELIQTIKTSSSHVFFHKKRGKKAHTK